MKKLENLALYLANHPKVGQLGHTKLYKLIFFCDVTHLRQYGETITGSQYIKFQYGPVPSRAEKALKALRKAGAISVTREVLDEVRDIELMRVKACREADKKVFSKEELTTIETVAQNFGNRSAGELSDLSHREPAWVEAELHAKLDPELMFYGREEDPEGL